MMKTEPTLAQASPLPWSYYANRLGGFDIKVGYIPLPIASAKIEEIAQQIVRSVNHAEKLAEALRRASFVNPEDVIFAKNALAAYEKENQ